MGTVLFLADIHGNMPALRALDKEIERIRPDSIWFVGDAAGKGPEGDKAVDWVRERCDRFVKGNWDDGICKNYHEHIFPGLEFYYEQLGEERIKWLESLPFEDEILISGLLFRVVHGRPTDRMYRDFDSNEELAEGFTSKLTGKKYDAYICADSHMPYLRERGMGYAINTGSVGNSLGMTRVHAAVIKGEIGSSEKTPFSCEFLSIPYDNAEAIRIAERYPGMPDPEAYRREIMTGVYSRNYYITPNA